MRTDRCIKASEAFVPEECGYMEASPLMSTVHTAPLIPPKHLFHDGVVFGNLCEGFLSPLVSLMAWYSACCGDSLERGDSVPELVRLWAFVEWVQLKHWLA